MLALNRRHFAALALTGVTIAATPAHAANPVPFSTAGFTAAQDAGRPVLVEVTAPWCPTCRAQRPILSELTAQPRFSDMVVFNVDFDTQKDVLRSLGVQMQSTLIVFKGKTERGRSAGDTNRASIEALLAKSA